MADAPAAEGVEACAFDAYGTLFDVLAATRQCDDALGDRAEAVGIRWRHKQLEYSWTLSLRSDYAPFWEITCRALDYALAAEGVEDAALRDRLLASYFALDAYPDAISALQRLKSAGIRTAILSNGSLDMLIGAVTSSGLEPLIDDLISADAVRIYKPHPSVYHLAVDRLHLPAHRIGFVSSNGWDASGAAWFGMRVAWVNRAQAPAERLPGVVEWEMSSLSELPTAIGV